MPEKPSTSEVVGTKETKATPRDNGTATEVSPSTTGAPNVAVIAQGSSSDMETDGVEDPH